MNAKQTIDIPVILENGATIRIEATRLGGPQKVGILEARPFSELTNAVAGVASTFVDQLKKVGPTKASIEIGLEVGFEAGKLTALLVQGTTTANLKMVLEWEADKS